MYAREGVVTKGKSFYYLFLGFIACLNIPNSLNSSNVLIPILDRPTNCKNCRRMAENGFAPPPPPLGNFADISYLVEN